MAELQNKLRETTNSAQVREQTALEKEEAVSASTATAEGMTALMIAAEDWHKTTVEELLRVGGMPHSQRL